MNPSFAARSRYFPRRPFALVRARPKFRLFVQGQSAEIRWASLPSQPPSPRPSIPDCGHAVRRRRPSTDYLPQPPWLFFLRTREPERVTSRRGSRRNPGKLPALASIIRNRRGRGRVASYVPSRIPSSADDLLLLLLSSGCCCYMGTTTSHTCCCLHPTGGHRCPRGRTHTHTRTHKQTPPATGEWPHPPRFDLKRTRPPPF